MAPFATERQSFQLDAAQRRQLEQRLMALQLEKEQVGRCAGVLLMVRGDRAHIGALPAHLQTEAKLLKLEQSGLRTINARSEKQWLDSRLQTLAQDVSKLKLTLR